MCLDFGLDLPFPSEFREKGSEEEERNLFDDLVVMVVRAAASALSNPCPPTCLAIA